MRLRARPAKYRNVKTTVDGVTFDSLKEARRYQALKLLLAAKEIDDLVLQPKLRLAVNGVKVCDYRADFAYLEHGLRVWEDCKGMRTAAYILKKKLVMAIYGIDILET